MREPLEEGRKPGSGAEQREPGEERATGTEPPMPEQDQERGSGQQDVVLVDVSRFVGEHDLLPVVVEDLVPARSRAGRPAGAWPIVHVFAKRELGQAEIGTFLTSSASKTSRCNTEIRQPPLAEPDGGAEPGRAERALVAERDELPDTCRNRGPSKALRSRRGRPEPNACGETCEFQASSN